MKIQNEAHKNLKMATQWGELVCDADGVLEAPEEAAQFLLGQKGWKAMQSRVSGDEVLRQLKADPAAKAKAPVAAEEVPAEEAAPVVEAPKVEAPKAEAPKKEKWSRSK